MTQVIIVTVSSGSGYWRQRADEKFGDPPPPPKVDPGAFNGQRQGWKTPKCTASVRVALAGVHCWEISLG